MQRRNEAGYVLIYVLVAIFTLCSIAAALMSYTLHGIKTQEAMIQQMQDKYAAMGEIERAVAELEYACEHTLSGAGYPSQRDALSAAEEAYINCVRDFAEGNELCSFFDEASSPDAPSHRDYFIQFSTPASDTGPVITALVRLVLDSTIYQTDHVEDPDYRSKLIHWQLYGSDSGEPEPQRYQFSYRVSDVVFAFSSYRFGGDPP